MSDESVAVTSPVHASRRGWFRLALAVSVLLMLAVVIMLPLAIRSMREVLGRTSTPFYNMVTGEPMTREAAQAAQENTFYMNIGIVEVDEVAGQLTLAVSGNRFCVATCWSETITLASLDDDADERRGVPPFATIVLNTTDRVFSESVQLPMEGLPILYPYDVYHLGLGLSIEAFAEDGRQVEVDPQLLAERQAVITLQNHLPDLLMGSPRIIDPTTMQTVSSPFDYLAVQGLTFKRPEYLRIMAVIIILLMGVSAGMALFTRAIDDLTLRFGGLILGVWGVRSVLMPQSMGTVTVIDLALSWIILLLLLGLTFRGALYFRKRSELPWIRPKPPRAS